MKCTVLFLTFRLWLSILYIVYSMYLNMYTLHCRYWLRFQFNTYNPQLSDSGISCLSLVAWSTHCLDWCCSDLCTVCMKAFPIAHPSTYCLILGWKSSTCRYKEILYSGYFLNQIKFQTAMLCTKAKHWRIISVWKLFLNKNPWPTLASKE